MLPFKLSCIYPYPNVSVQNLPKLFLWAPALVGLLAIWLFYTARYTRKILFGGMFFFLAILPVLQIIPFGNALAADRYTYVASIGLFYLLAEGFIWLFARPWRYCRLVRYTLVFLLALIATTMCFFTWERAKIWNNSLTLFEDVLEKYPGSYLAYNNIGVAYLDRKEYSRAISNFKQAAKIDPKSPFAYINLCNTNNLIGNYHLAKMFGWKAVMLAPGNAMAYFNLANAYSALGKDEKAQLLYRKAISIKKDYAEAYQNLAAIYADKGEIDKAIEIV